MPAALTLNDIGTGLSLVIALLSLWYAVSANRFNERSREVELRMNLIGGLDSAQRSFKLLVEHYDDLTSDVKEMTTGDPRVFNAVILHLSKLRFSARQNELMVTLTKFAVRKLSGRALNRLYERK